MFRLVCLGMLLTSLALPAGVVAESPGQVLLAQAVGTPPQGGDQAADNQPGVKVTVARSSWKDSLSALLVVLLVGGSLCAICRSSQRT